MQLAVFDPTEAGHLRHFLVHFEALCFKGFDGVGSQLEGQLPGKEALKFSFCLEGFMQPFGAVLRQSFALGLRGQRVEGVQLRGHFWVLVQEPIQRELVVFSGLGQGFAPGKAGSGPGLEPLASGMAAGAFIQAAIDPIAHRVEQKQ